MKKILSIFGTRPEAIKMAPVIKMLENQPERFPSMVCVTARHRQMLDQVLNLYTIQHDYDLGIMKPGQDLFDVTCNVLQGLRQERPDKVRAMVPEIGIGFGLATGRILKTLGANLA